MLFLLKPLALIICISELTQCISLDITCKSESNENVDWFIIYKMPKIARSQKWIEEGYGYFYMDSNYMKWQLSKVPLNGTNHAIYYTLQQVYDNIGSQDHAFAFYNDETPEKKVTSTHGHTKGVIDFDKSSGYWLIHSLPRFPNLKGYSWPSSGRTYGQTFLCISMNYAQLDLIGTQLLYTYPQIYNASFPKQFLNENPNMSKVINGHYEKGKNMVSLKSSAGQTFLSFAKSSDFDADLYDAWVAPYFESDMFTETWQNGVNKTKSNCSTQYEVENIQNIRIDIADFHETKDHSKWGVTRDKKWICIGGINRMESQKERAGGTVCANIPQVWQAFNSSITTIEVCPLNSSKIRVHI